VDERLSSPTVRALLERGRRGRVVVLTGAGISAESGIPTFRGPEGYWTVGSTEYQPQELATAQAFRQMPQTIWHWYLYRRSVCRAAEPNPAHRAIVELERALGDRFWLVTQNVDGLHIRAGNSLERTCQIHGNIDYMRCTRPCGVDPMPVPDTIPPKHRDDALTDDEFWLLRCPSCDAPTRPHVLWFDEYYEEELFRSSTAVRVAARCDLLLVIGTSGSTTLPMHVLAEASRNDAAIIDVNPDDNPFGEFAASSGGAALAAPAGELVPAIVEALVE
jgi:NAD-dependent deacetylase